LGSDRLPAGDLHTEAIEAERLRAIGLRMRLVPETITRFSRAAASAESRMRRADAGDRPRGTAIEWELLSVVDLSKCLRHDSLF
jgi:hypothetical protein